MPELVRFDGLVIVMFYYDSRHHNKPHVHVFYGDCEASIGLNGEILAGSLPVKQAKQEKGWSLEHEFELRKAWNLAVRGESFDDIRF